MATKASLEAELIRLKNEHNELTLKMQSMQSQLIEQVVKTTIKSLQPKDPIQAEVLWRLRRTRREFVYKKIIELLNNNHKEIAELKYLIVDQGRYCSKATFYRYIDTLQEIGRITIAQINDKLMAVPKQE
ncbi:MAG: hypothetical protein AABX51_00285 [Nanoarchaeota archaeon]